MIIKNVRWPRAEKRRATAQGRPHWITARHLFSRGVCLHVRALERFDPWTTSPRGRIRHVAVADRAHGAVLRPAGVCADGRRVLVVLVAAMVGNVPSWQGKFELIDGPITSLLFHGQSDSLEPPNSRRNALLSKSHPNGLRAASSKEVRMASTGLFQQRVIECRRLADAARNASDKMFWLGLVERWQVLESRSACGRYPAPGRSASSASLASNTSPRKTRRRHSFLSRKAGERGSPLCTKPDAEFPRYVRARGPKARAPRLPP
jgi:hypothetical protein